MSGHFPSIRQKPTCPEQGHHEREIAADAYEMTSTPADSHLLPSTIRFSASKDGRFQHAEEVWDGIRDDLHRLYIVENLPLKEVARILRGCGFSAR